MLTRAPQNEDTANDQQAAGQLESATTQSSREASLPKNRSTSDLLRRSSAMIMDASLQKRASFDTGSVAEHDTTARSPIIPEHEHGIGASGLRRIRQQPPRAAGGAGADYLPPSTSASLALSLSPSRNNSITLPSGPTSPSLPFGEDLARFSSESLHSFSFAYQAGDSFHNRQNILTRSIDFMRDRFGWAASSPGIASAQARISGDQELKSMMELLARAKVFEKEGSYGQGTGLLRGPLTGPAGVSGENIFEKSFLPSMESPVAMAIPAPSGSEAKSSPEVAEFEQVESTETTTTGLGVISEGSSRSSTQGSDNASRAPALANRRAALKRTYTDIVPISLQDKLTEALAQPYNAQDNQKESAPLSPTPLPGITHAQSFPVFGNHAPNAAPHGHGSRRTPAAQAIFTTEAHAPWTITSANDLACLVFGVTRSELRKTGILELVREERRKWLEEMLRSPNGSGLPKAARGTSSQSQSERSSPTPSTSLFMGNGVTARLLSKPPSRQSARLSKTENGGRSSSPSTKSAKPETNHQPTKSRGVLICGDVVPIQKRNGATGSASLWVKEKRGGLIWVLEEIAEDVAYLSVDEIGSITEASGAIEAVWGLERVRRGMDIRRLIPSLPKLDGTHTGALDYERIAEQRRYTARTSNNINSPITIDPLAGEPTFRVSSLPHISGIVVLSSSTLMVTSSNNAAISALFGYANAEGLHITELIPAFDDILDFMTVEDKISLVDGIVIPEHSFRRGRAMLALREGRADAAAVFLRPSGLPAKHRDGAEIMVDIQMRVVKNEPKPPIFDETVTEGRRVDGVEQRQSVNQQSSEVVYALWVTYSKHLHAANHGVGPVTPLLSRPGTPPHQPSPGQSMDSLIPDSPEEVDSDEPKTEALPSPHLAEQIKEATSSTLAERSTATLEPRQFDGTFEDPPHRKSINDFVVLEEMGQGAYGQVKLARYKNSSKKMVIKYVTKRRILVDTWTRDRRLGTVPLEIHVLDYLRRDGLKHPNVVEMADFFEDDINYYIEMVPHGLPGMDLFDYIELRVNMDESECKSIFVQVASALHHLHIKAKVVHRDIKDENVVLDGEGNIKLIDFGSATYIKNGPFDVFVGTIDYAAPEVLAGKSYRGKEQDVWALGILLYTIIYKENPFYSIDEIMDHDLRVPYIMSEDTIDLIRCMLDRDVDRRISIGQVLEHPWCRGAELKTGW